MLVATAEAGDTVIEMDVSRTGVILVFKCGRVGLCSMLIARPSCVVKSEVGEVDVVMTSATGATACTPPGVATAS